MGFTGKEADEEVGLTYFGQRYLMAHLGRWASPDPLQTHAVGGGEAINGYHYVAGNVLQARDPLGLECGVDESCDPSFETGSDGGSPDGAGASVEDASDATSVRGLQPYAIHGASEVYDRAAHQINFDTLVDAANQFRARNPSVGVEESISVSYRIGLGGGMDFSITARGTVRMTTTGVVINVSFSGRFTARVPLNPAGALARGAGAALGLLGIGVSADVGPSLVYGVEIGGSGSFRVGLDGGVSGSAALSAQARIGVDVGIGMRASSRELDDAEGPAGPGAYARTGVGVVATVQRFFEITRTDRGRYEFGDGETTTSLNFYAQVEHGFNSFGLAFGERRRVYLRPSELGDEHLGAH